MMKSDFQEMSMERLRAYVLEHRDDDEAFYVFVDRLQASPNRVVCTTPEEIEAELQKRISK
ncbi:MAG: hypothetical protein KME64_24830 [Scytonematopsis contorta HA4267-MV1]|jgi:hypothetical protein|nr:hypothetical protein [Scytonematopsis contorta HA4267-MV1]